jgi:lysozyme
VYPDESVYRVSGLDISNHQGFVDWGKVDKKYKFVFVKATEAVTFVDKRFFENAEGIKRDGRVLGAYHFFHLNYGGAEQAENFINTVGDIIDLPPVIDFEFTGNPESFGKRADVLVNELRKCVNTLEKRYNREIIIYTTRDAYKYVIKDNFENPIWYRSIILPVNKNIPNVLFWQYHNSARINGVSAPVDLNVFKGSLDELSNLIIKK